MRYFLVFILLPTTILLTSCDSGTSLPKTAEKKPATVSREPSGLVSEVKPQLPDAPKPTVRTLLTEPLTPTLVETSAEALPAWREAASLRPSLILISNNPLLGPIPSAVRDDIKNLLATGTAADFNVRMVPDRANPLLLPHMALSAALEQGYFGRVVWMLPIKPGKNGDITPLREILQSMGDISRDEAATLVVKDGRLTGTIRQTPFEILPFGHLPKIDGPVFVHIETGFFSPLYSSEIKTPIYPTVIQLFTELRAGGYRVAGVTIDHGNQYYGLPLRVRFLGNFLAELLKEPAKLDRGPDKVDILRSEALYLENFLRKDDVRERYLAIAAENPGDAAINFDLYAIAKRYKDGSKALEYLDRAVAGDKHYALEYLQLAGQAMAANRPDQAIRMLQLAYQVFPDNPFILLNLADIYLQSGQPEKAAPLLTSLETMAWSPTYHAKIPGIIEGMKKAATGKKPPKG